MILFTVKKQLQEYNKCLNETSHCGLGLPFPELQAYLATTTEFLGVWMLIFGIGTRLISIPLIGTMLVAILNVHLDHGWYIIGQSALSPEIAERISTAKDIFKSNGNLAG
jgi:uncharacterized membrane protein YphA (DoxX/SURF4 family)